MYGKTMYPRPPDMRQKDTQEMSDGELYYTIKNGVRLSGMPALGDPGDDDVDSLETRGLHSAPVATHGCGRDRDAAPQSKIPRRNSGGEGRRRLLEGRREIGYADNHNAPPLTTRRRHMKKVLATLFTLVLMVSSAHAHNGMEHVMGIVASITDNSIRVTTTDGKTQTVTATADTKYSKMNAAIALKDVKVGDHVVIHATKKDGKLIAATVQVGVGKMAGMKMSGRSSSPQPK
jgi:hypothetical protein